MSNKRIALVRIYLNKMRLECKAALPQEMHVSKQHIFHETEAFTNLYAQESR